MLNYRTSASELKSIADVLKDVLAECWFVFHATYITMNNVDPEKVIAVNLRLNPDPLVYQCSEKIVFPFYIQTLYRVLRGVKKTDLAVLQMFPENGNALDIIVLTDAGVMKNKITIQPLQDTLPSFIRHPQKYSVEVKIETHQFYRILHDLSALSRKVNIKIDRDEVSFISQDDSGTRSVFTQGFPELNYQFDGTYLIKYLEKFCKPNLAPEIKIRVEKNTPLSVVYHLERGSLEMSIAQSA